ncbi:hypothetical protein EJ06DRAFT_468094 [Trichodelitschia bisporula]|uniref:BAG domain-containing protein n=1 Tax=Trichodelitschia bisporula TaxID=703511 RepID=A0A6G1I9X9_9PEZI|nr:hypothetical protein EJ06DRAFT_468094 [Trichodelitschia bisporula]
MSTWSRFGPSSWGGRFSPFSRPGAGEVSDADFSYITSEDLARQHAAPSASRPGSASDVVVLKHRRVSYPVHFPAASIDGGVIKIGDIRSAAARSIGVPLDGADRIKMFFRGQNLKDDGVPARDVGFRSGVEAEVLVIVGEKGPEDEDESDGEEEIEVSEGGKKKKTRKRKSKKSKKKAPTDGPAGYTTSPNLNPDATYAPAAAPPPPAAPAAPRSAPKSAMEVLDALASTFHTKFVPQCVQFTAHPPEDKAKRAFDHKRLTETLMTQILLKLDGVETEGDAAARTRRKDLVREVQGMMHRLDEVGEA